MKKADAIVALVGAVVLAAAVGVVAAQQEAAGDALRVAATLSAQREAAALGTHAPGQAFEEQATVTLGRAGLHALVVNVTLTPTPAFLSGGSARVVVTAPNGTTYEAEAPVPQGAAPALVTVEVPIRPVPTGLTIPAGTAAEREAALAALASREGAGDWTILLAYAPGPLPSPRVEAAATVDVHAWDLRVEDPLPPAK